MNALLVVGDKAALAAGDTVLQSRLGTTHGHTVTLRSDEESEDVTGQDFVVVAHSCSSGTIGTKYRDVAIPVMLLEGALTDEYGFADNPGSEQVESQFTLLDEADALAGGNLEAGNPHSMFSVGRTVGIIDTATIATGFVSVWQTVNGTVAAVIGYIPNGANRADDTEAPALRIAFLFSDAAVADLDGNGTDVLDASINKMEAEGGGGGGGSGLLLKLMQMNQFRGGTL